jgi:hypothetical protein
VRQRTIQVFVGVMLAILGLPKAAHAGWVLSGSIGVTDYFNSITDTNPDDYYGASGFVNTVEYNPIDRNLYASTATPYDRGYWSIDPLTNNFKWVLADGTSDFGFVSAKVNHLSGGVYVLFGGGPALFVAREAPTETGVLEVPTFDLFSFKGANDDFYVVTNSKQDIAQILGFEPALATPQTVAISAPYTNVLAVNPNSGHIYAGSLDHKLTIYDSGGTQVLQLTLDADAQIVAIAANPGRNEIYASVYHQLDPTKNSLMVINGSTNAFQNILFGPNLGGDVIDFNPANSEVYVCGNLPSVTSCATINTTASSVGSPVLLPAPVQSLTYDSDDDKLYFTTKHDETSDSSIYILSRATVLDTAISGAVDGAGKPVADMGTTSSASLSLSFVSSGDLATSTLQCSLDGAAYVPCTSPVTYSGLVVNIQHKVSVRAVGSDGKVDETPATFSWTFVPAPFSLTCPPDQHVATTALSTRVDYPPATVIDDVATPTITYSHPSGTRFPLGNTQVVVTATDDAGNSAQCTFTVRAVPPGCSAVPGDVAELGLIPLVLMALFKGLRSRRKAGL